MISQLPVSFRIETNPSTLSRSSMGQMAGEIWVTLDALAFPAAGWSDSVVVVVATWLADASSLLRGGSGFAIFRFMDGPFAIRATYVANNVLRLEGTRAGRSVDGACIDVSVAEFRKQLIAVARMLLNECRARGWLDRDVESLSRGLSAV